MPGTMEEKRAFLLAVVEGCERASEDLNGWDLYDWSKCAFAWGRAVNPTLPSGMTVGRMSGEPAYEWCYGLRALERFLMASREEVRNIFGGAGRGNSPLDRAKRAQDLLAKLEREEAVAARVSRLGLHDK